MRKPVFLKMIYAVILTAIFITSGPYAREVFSDDKPEKHGISTGSLKALSNLINEYVENERIVGAELAIVKDRHTIYHETFGWKDRDDNLAMQKNSLFNIRSMTKTITGAAIQILIDEGKLNLKDPAAKYLSGFNNQKSKMITIEQLLTHHSGLPLTILTDFTDFEDIQIMTDSIGQRGPKYEPGSTFWYSDAGTDALAAIVEVVSGKKLEDFVQKRIFDPLGMENTLYFTKRLAYYPDNIVSLHIANQGQWTRYWKEGDDPLYNCPWGSQSIYSTICDYAKFLAMWMDNGRIGESVLLSPEAVSRTLTPVSRMKTLGMDMLYPTAFPNHAVFHGQLAMLFVDTVKNQTEVIGYGGSDGTFAWAWPDKDLMILYFTQSRGQATSIGLEAELYGLFIDTAYFNKSNVVSNKLAPFLGTYAFDDPNLQHTNFGIIAQNNSLALDIPGQMAYELLPLDNEGWCFFKLTNMSGVKFGLDSSGQAAAMLFRQDTPFPLKKGSAASSATVSGPRIYIGEYYLPMNQGILKVILEDEKPVILRPDGIKRILTSTDDPMIWYIENDPNRKITFQLDDSGRISSMLLTEITPMHRIK